MKKNDHFTVEITDMGMDGEGIGKYEGMTFFIKDAVVGDTIEAAVTKLKKNYGYARLVKVLKASPDRVEPRCPVAKACGGCQMQALSYEKQLELKQRKVYDVLHRIGGFSDDLLQQVMEPVVGMSEPFRYRNKAQFPVGYDKDQQIVTGFYAARSHRIVPVEDCLLGVEDNQEILEIITGYMRKNGVEPYDEETHRGLVRHILIRKGFTSGQIMVCLVINGSYLPQEEKLCQALSVIPGMESISININTRNTNVILGEETKCIWGQPYITDVIHRVKEKDPQTYEQMGQQVEFEISPRSFYQVNPVQTEKLYSLALEYAGLTGQETVWDLYCGIGTISLFLAKEAKQVYGVEIIPEAIEDAKRNASRNEIRNVEFFVGKAEEVVPEWMEEQSESIRHPDVIVVDPPRKGCDIACLNTMLLARPERIVYVSCDPATLARDLKILCGEGYELKHVRPVDQFCHSGHVETVVLLSKVQK